MDREYEKIVGLRNDIIKLREKKASLQATLSVLEKEKEKYINELAKKGVSPDQIDHVIKRNEKKIEEISNKISEIKKVLEKYFQSLNV